MTGGFETGVGVRDRVRFNGVELAGLEPDAINRAGLGIVPEDRRIFPGLSVQENLEIGLNGRKTLQSYFCLRVKPLIYSNFFQKTTL